MREIHIVDDPVLAPRKLSGRRAAAALRQRGYLPREATLQAKQGELFIPRTVHLAQSGRAGYLDTGRGWRRVGK
jgi:hypothetical protein